MNQPDGQSISQILRNHQLKPDKSLGQNFLTDPNILDKIIGIAEVTASDSILEIGAGLGHLTARLAQNAQQVTAVELDGRFLPILTERLAAYPNITLIEGDILGINQADLIQEDDYLVVANIPYYITSRIIRHLLESPHQPSRIILTIQYEVARRICARDGKLSLLALSVLIYGQPELMLRIPAGAFFPKPDVDSAVIKIDLYEQPLLDAELRERFFALIKAGFLHKRKTLRNSLSKGLGWAGSRVEEFLLANGVDPQQRAERISLEQWLDLVRAYDTIQPSAKNKQEK